MHIVYLRQTTLTDIICHKDNDIVITEKRVIARCDQNGTLRRDSSEKESRRDTTETHRLRVISIDLWPHPPPILRSVVSAYL